MDQSEHHALPLKRQLLGNETPARSTSASAIASVEVVDAFLLDIFPGPLCLGDAIEPTVGDLALYRAHGEYFENPQPLFIRRRTKANCWKNASDGTWQHGALTYVQGLVRGASGVVLPHAWCTDDSGALYEPTWDVDTATGLETYFGLRLARASVCDLQTRSGTYDWYTDLSAVVRLADIGDPADVTRRPVRARDRGRRHNAGGRK